MTRFLKNIYRNLKIKYKLFTSILLVATISLLLVGSICSDYVITTLKNNERDLTDKSVETETQAVRKEISNLYSNIDVFLSGKAVTDTLLDIDYQNKDDWVDDYVGLQSGLRGLTDSNDLIDSVMLQGKHGEFFSTTDVGLNFNFPVVRWKDTSVPGAAWLTERESPFSSGQEVIPFLIPLAYRQQIIPCSTGDSSAVLFLLLDVKRLNSLLDQVNKNPFAMVYIADRNGAPLTAEKDTALYPASFSTQITRSVKNAGPSAAREIRENGDTYTVRTSELGYCKLKLVVLGSQNRILAKIKDVKKFIFGAWIAAFVVSVVLAVMLSYTFCVPLRKLTKAVQKSGDGSIPVVWNSNDELGMLNQSLNSMSNTIRIQIEKIREEAHKRTLAEITALTEQINPHFLYNTLECIHLEILTGNRETSSAMVESLGSFLRLGLNNGSSTITLEDEILHTREYLNIMNIRMRTRIRFISQVENGLNDMLIPKIILQPLAENSIRHGFDGISSPCLTVTAFKKQDRAVLILEDNGKGIELKKAEAALHSSPQNMPGGRIGLANVYQRLRYYYGESVRVTFESTPYYKNCVVIDVPCGT